MRGFVSAVAAVALLLAACGDDDDDADGSGDSETSSTTASATQAQGSGDEAASEGADVEQFCEDYRAAQLAAENPASTDHFRDVTPPAELASIWPDYVDSDFDAGVTVDGFVADNCFEDLTG